ncbi:MAG: putative transposable element tc3 transposase, partial [Streblomastix strix]
FDVAPLLSYRSREAESGVPRSSLQRLANEFGFHSYRDNPIEQLSAQDKLNRHAFQLLILEKSLRIPDFFFKIWFYDECLFELGGQPKVKNMYYSSRKNPSFHFDKPHKQKGKMIWVTVSGAGLICPFFYDNSVNTLSYQQLLSDKFLPELNARHRNASQFFYQQDGAPAHYALDNREILDQIFLRRQIGRERPIKWPARSPDLSPLDFWLWGILRDQ